MQNDQKGKPRQAFVLTILVQDDYGILEEVCEFLFARGSNLGASMFATLGQKFAIVLFADTSQYSRIETELPGFSKEKKWETILMPTEFATPKPRSLSYRLTTLGRDAAGLVYRISTSLRRIGVNIRQGETYYRREQKSRKPKYAIEMRLGVPDNKVGELRQRVEKLSEDLEQEINLEQLEWPERCNPSGYDTTGTGYTWSSD